MRRLFFVIGTLLTLPLLGAVGFVLIEGWSWLDAIYMAVITLTTVGFQEVHPLTDPGRVYVLILLVTGLALFFYCLTQLGEIAASGGFREYLKGRRMSQTISSMQRHTIICGGGKTGLPVAQQLHAAGKPVLVIDKDDDTIAELQRTGIPWVQGDATEDDALESAGIKRAKSLTTTLNNDSDNVFVILAARLLNPELHILARCHSASAEAKMRKAGAHRIISPYTAAAGRMAQMLMNPNMEEFYEVLVDEESGIDLAVVEVPGNSPVIGKTAYHESLIDQGVTVVGIRRGQETILPPKNSDTIQAGDRLIAIGLTEAINRFTSASS